MTMLDERVDECVATLDRERMAVEIVFRLREDGEDHLYWVAIRGEGGRPPVVRPTRSTSTTRPRRPPSPGWVEAEPQVLMLRPRLSAGATPVTACRAHTRAWTSAPGTCPSPPPGCPRATRVRGHRSSCSTAGRLRPLLDLVPDDRRPGRAGAGRRYDQRGRWPVGRGRAPDDVSLESAAEDLERVPDAPRPGELRRSVGHSWGARAGRRVRRPARDVQASTRRCGNPRRPRSDRCVRPARRRPPSQRRSREELQAIRPTRRQCPEGDSRPSWPYYRIHVPACNVYRARPRSSGLTASPGAGTSRRMTVLRAVGRRGTPVTWTPGHSAEHATLDCPAGSTSAVPLLGAARRGRPHHRDGGHPRRRTAIPAAPGACVLTGECGHFAVLEQPRQPWRSEVTALLARLT